MGWTGRPHGRCWALRERGKGGGNHGQLERGLAMPQWMWWTSLALGGRPGGGESIDRVNVDLAPCAKGRVSLNGFTRGEFAVDK